MLKICVIDDEVSHRERIKRILLDVIPTAMRQTGCPISSKDFAIDTIDNAIDMIREIQAASQQPESFPYDVLIADVFMPSDPGGTREQPFGGAVRIYNAVKQAGLADRLILLIVSKDVEGAEDGLAPIRAEQRQVSEPWAFVLEKPGPLSSQPAETAADADAWATVVADLIARRNDQEWRKRTFVRLPASDVVENSYFSNARMRIDSLLANGRCSFLLLTGEVGTGKETLAQYVANRKNTDMISLVLREGEERSLALRLFGRELPSPREGLLEKNPKSVIFIDDFALNSDRRTDLDHKIFDLLVSLSTTEFGGGFGTGTFYRQDGVDKKEFTGVIILSCRSINDLSRNAYILPNFKKIMEGYHIYLPPLRKVKGTILPFARHYLSLLDKGQSFQGSAVTLLRSYDWPRNIKEIEERITAAADHVGGEWISDEDLRSVGIEQSNSPVNVVHNFCDFYWKLRGCVYRRARYIWDKIVGRPKWSAIVLVALTISSFFVGKFFEKLTEKEVTTAADRVREFFSLEQPNMPQGVQSSGKDLSPPKSLDDKGISVN